MRGCSVLPRPRVDITDYGRMIGTKWKALTNDDKHGNTETVPIPGSKMTARTTRR